MEFAILAWTKLILFNSTVMAGRVGGPISMDVVRADDFRVEIRKFGNRDSAFTLKTS